MQLVSVWRGSVQRSSESAAEFVTVGFVQIQFGMVAFCSEYMVLLVTERFVVVG